MHCRGQCDMNIDVMIDIENEIRIKPLCDGILQTIAKESGAPFSGDPEDRRYRVKHHRHVHGYALFESSYRIRGRSTVTQGHRVIDEDRRRSDNSPEACNY